MLARINNLSLIILDALLVSSVIIRENYTDKSDRLVL